MASTLVVSLELARAGEITLHQDGGFGDITVHAAPAVAQETPTAEAGG